MSTTESEPHTSIDNGKAATTNNAASSANPHIPKPAKGSTQSAAELYHRVNIEECLYTDNFEVTDACISCGHCEDICPAYAIKLNEEGIPTWIKHECFMCFGCMRLCPCKAIRYGGA